MKVTKERVPVLRLSPPFILRTGGYAENRFVMVVYGKAGSGKSTLAHALLHMAERSQIQLTIDGKPTLVQFIPIGVLLEEARLHSYAECPAAKSSKANRCHLVEVVSTYHGGNVQEVVLAVVAKRLREAAGKKSAKEIQVPFVAVDTASMLTQGSDRMGDRWRAVMGFLEGLYKLSNHSVVILLAQEREALQTSGPFRFGRPALADSIMHQVHLKVHTTRTGSETTTFRLSVQAVNMVAPQVPASPIEITYDSLVLLMSPVVEAKGHKKLDATSPVMDVKFGGWVEIYVPRD